MEKIINKFKNKYFLFSFAVVMICIICLSSYGVFVVNTNNYRSNEMYFGKLIYQISLQSKSSSATVNGKVVSLTSANATSTILMKVTSLNPVKSRYNIEYKVTSGNVSVKYSNVTGWLPQGYLDDSYGLVYEKIVKINITNTSGTAATVALDVAGGYAYNSDSNVETLAGYTKLVNGNSSSIFDDSSASSVKVLSTRVKNDTECTPTSSAPCIYGGEISRNYLSYSGDIYRIIGVYLINGVESVKLVKATNYSTATTYNTHQSIFQTWKNNLYLSSDYLKTSSPFCTTDILTCSSPTFDYGLITKKEYENMGMHYSYLNNGTNSITTTETGSNVYYIKTDGTLGTIAKTTSSSGRPVLYLKNDIKVIKTTNGSSENPYQLAPTGDLFINSITVDGVASSSSPASGNYIMTSSCTCDQETCGSDTIVSWDGTNHTIDYTLGTNAPTVACDLTFRGIISLQAYGGTLSVNTMELNANSSGTSTLTVSTGYTLTGTGVKCTSGISGSISGSTLTINTTSVRQGICQVVTGKTFAYTGGVQTYDVLVDGTYKIEVWGAQGANNAKAIAGAKGSYARGNILLEDDELLYVVVGSRSGYNGGGTRGTIGYSTNIGGNGGGATDIRLKINGGISNSISLASRIIVAAGGGGPGGSRGTGQYLIHPTPLGYGHAGNGHTNRVSGSAGGFGGGSYAGYGNGGTGDVTSVVTTCGSNGGNGSFGLGGNGGIPGAYVGNHTSYQDVYSGGSGGGGGGGYFGGGGGGGACGWWSYYGGSGGGGSSYISGHVGSVAIKSEMDLTEKNNCTVGTTDINCSIHHSNKVFTNTKIIDGAGYYWTGTKQSLEQMPTPSGGYYSSGAGRAGNGYAIITFVP